MSQSPELPVDQKTTKPESTIEADTAAVAKEAHLRDVYFGRVPPGPDDPVIEGYDDLGFGPAVPGHHS